MIETTLQEYERKHPLEVAEALALHLREEIKALELQLKRAMVRLEDKACQIERMRSTVIRLEDIEQKKLQLEIRVLALTEELSRLACSQLS